MYLALAVAALTTPAVMAQQPAADPTSSTAESDQTADDTSSTKSLNTGSAEVPEPESADTNEGRTPNSPAEHDASEPLLRFSFEGARWREVLDWLAEQGQLALHIGDLPTGSFTYSDQEYFTVDEAISRLNLFLLPQGYAAVRRGRLLTVITLGDQRSLQQLDTMAQVVSPEQLDELDPHEVVKTFVPLGETSAEDAIAELQPLSLMIAPIHLPQSNQLILTGTAGKLRSAIDVIGSMKKPAEESAVKRFDLEHVTAETVLLVAGGHLGIPEDETSGIDIAVTTDITGKQLYAVGNPEKIEKLDQLLKVLDVPAEAGVETEESELVSHPVAGGNLQGVYDVLQTLLAGESIRLSMQEETSSIVAYAPQRVHAQIEQTIEQLQAPSVEFAVIDLKGADPYFAVSLVNEMFSNGDSSDDDRDRYWRRDRDRDDDDSDENKPSPPKVDADPEKGRLFVRGTANQIKQVEELVAEISGTVSSGSETRLVPLSGDQRYEALRAAKQWWSERGRLEVLPPFDREADVIERSIHDEENRVKASANSTADEGRRSREKTFDREANSLPPTLPSDDSANSPANAFDLVSSPADSAARIQLASEAGRNQAGHIRSQVVPQGIIIQSDDTQALDQFETFLRTLSDEAGQAISPPVIYYLKYVTAEEAVNMLADLLDGAGMLDESSGNSLVSGSTAFSGDGYYGSLLFSRDGMTTMTAGTATIVSDGRLNRLIVQGTSEDVAMIDRYMEIIDKEASITDIQTAGQTHVIELIHTKAEDVAEIVRDAFPDRVTEQEQAAQRGRANERDRGRDDRRDDDDRRDGQRQPAIEKPTRGQQPKMAIAVHPRSNSLVITAPDPLFEDVKRLVDSIDQRSEQVVEVIAPSEGVNMETIIEALTGEAAVSLQGESRRSEDRRGNRDRNRD